MGLYKNKYRTDTTRLKCWDYTTPWWCYVTICTKRHKEWFGEVSHSKMILNSHGKRTEKYWKDITNHYTICELDYYVIMPNHIHGIIIIDPDIETGHAPSLLHSLGNIVGSFKSAVTRFAHRNGYEKFNWQPRFYDRTIRNDRELYQIRKYIEQNPMKWDIKKNIPDNLDDF